MRQAIITKYLGPTERRGSRISARCEAASIVVAWDHALNPRQNHQAAAEALAWRLGWDGIWTSGALPDGRCAFVQDDGDGFRITTERSGA